MEIEKIVSTVQERLGKTDVSAQTIQKAVEFRNTVAPLADGVEPDDAYFTGIVNLARDFQGNINHLLAGKADEWKKNFKLDTDTIRNMNAEQLAEVKRLIEGIKPEEKPVESDEVKALKEQIKQLTERLDDGDKAKRHAELLQRVKAAMREQKADDEYVLENTLRDAALDADKSIDELVVEQLARYDAEYLRCRGAGAPPRLSDGGGSGDRESWLDKKFKQKAAKEGWGKKQ